MDVLLDTHTLIWFAEGDRRLSSKADIAITKAVNKYVSIVSLWEIVIKSSINKLDLKRSFVEINQFLMANNISIVSININHLTILRTLPHHHGDPFDRLMISQAMSENFAIVSADRHFAAYEINVIW